MSFETDLVNLLNPLVDSLVFWDVTPDGFKGYPFIVLQQVGGRSGWYLESELPSHKHARIQIECYGKGRQAAGDLARLVEKTICESITVSEPYGAFASGYEHALKLNQTRQDFGFWYPDI